MSAGPVGPEEERRQGSRQRLGARFSDPVHPFACLVSRGRYRVLGVLSKEGTLSDLCLESWK